MIEIAERIKTLISDIKLDVDGPSSIVTVSMGISSYCGDENYDSSKLIKEADQALYKSKKDGRNRITIHKKKKKTIIGDD